MLTVRQAISLLEHMVRGTEAEYRWRLTGYATPVTDAIPPTTIRLDPGHRQLTDGEISELFRSSLECDGSLLTRDKVLMDIPHHQLFGLLKTVTLECLVPHAAHSTIYIVPPGTARTPQFVALQRKVFLEGLRLSGMAVSAPGTGDKYRHVYVKWDGPH